MKKKMMFTGVPSGDLRRWLLAEDLQEKRPRQQ